MAYIFGSIWDRFNRNALNDLSKSVEYQGKSIQDLVAKGQLTPTQYATLIQTVNGLIAKGEVNLNDLSEEVLKKFAEVSPEFNLLSIPRDKSVTPKKVSFMKKSTNLFEGDYDTGILTYYRDDYCTRKNYDGYDGRTAVIPIVPSQQYTIKVHDKDMQNQFRVAVHNSYPIYGETYFDQPVDTMIVDNQALSEYTFTNTSTGRFLIVYVSNNGKEPRLQVQTGGIATEYVPGLYIDEEYIHYPEVSVGVENLTFLEKSEKNIFNGKYEDGLLFARVEDRKLIPIKNYSTFLGKTAIVPIKANKTYSVKVHEPNKQTHLRMAVHSERVEFLNVSGNPSSSAIPLDDTINYNTLLQEYTFTNTSTGRYLYVYVANNGNEPLLQVEESPRPTKFENHYFIPSNLIKSASDSDSPEDGQIEHPDETAKSRFIDEMNNYANRLEMLESNFVEPAGFPSTIEQTMSTRDMVKLGVYASGYKDLVEAWSKKSYTVDVVGSNTRSIEVEHSFDIDYFNNQNNLFLGGKTGGVGGTSDISGYHLLAFSMLPSGNVMVGAIRKSTQTDRFNDLIKSFNNANKNLNGDTTGLEGIIAESADVVILPANNPYIFSHFNLPALYEKDSSSIGHPASVTKVMSAIVMLDCIDDLKRTITIKPSDITSGTGPTLSAGDEITLIDALYLMMLPSSNTATHAVARYVGNIILNNEL